MARFDTSPRSLGRRLRGAAVAALIVGAAGAFIPGAHAAHAMSLQPAATTCGAITQALASIPNSTVNGAVTINGFLSNPAIVVTYGATNPLPVAGFSGASCPTTDGITDLTSLTSSTVKYTTADVTNNMYTCNMVLVSRFVVAYSNPVSVPAGDNLLATTVAPGNDLLEVALRCSNGTIITETTTFAGGGTNPSGVNNTPELGSGDLLALGLVPVVGLYFRRRRQRRAGK